MRPDWLAFSADEHLLLAADSDSGDVSVIRTADRNGSHAVHHPAGRRLAQRDRGEGHAGQALTLVVDRSSLRSIRSNPPYCEITISDVLVMVSVLVGPHGMDSGNE